MKHLPNTLKVVFPFLLIFFLFSGNLFSQIYEVNVASDPEISTLQGNNKSLRKVFSEIQENINTSEASSHLIFFKLTAKDIVLNQPIVVNGPSSPLNGTPKVIFKIDGEVGAEEISIFLNNNSFLKINGNVDLVFEKEDGVFYSGISLVQGSISEPLIAFEFQSSGNHEIKLNYFPDFSIYENPPSFSGQPFLNQVELIHFQTNSYSIDAQFLFNSCNLYGTKSLINSTKIPQIDIVNCKIETFDTFNISMNQTSVGIGGGSVSDYTSNINLDNIDLITHTTDNFTAQTNTDIFKTENTNTSVFIQNSSFRVPCQKLVDRLSSSNTFIGGVVGSTYTLSDYKYIYSRLMPYTGNSGGEINLEEEGSTSSHWGLKYSLDLTSFTGNHLIDLNSSADIYLYSTNEFGELLKLIKTIENVPLSYGKTGDLYTSLKKELVPNGMITANAKVSRTPSNCQSTVSVTNCFLVTNFSDFTFTECVNLISDQSLEIQLSEPTHNYRGDFPSTLKYQANNAQSTWVFYAQLAREKTAHGISYPDWETAETKLLGINQSNVSISFPFLANLYSGEDLLYLRVGYEVSGGSGIHWSNFNRIRIVGNENTLLEPGLSGETENTFIANHTGKINWEYSSTFLDDNKQAETMNYFDGLGQVRQTQVKNQSEAINKIITTEYIHSVTGSQLVTLPAPLVAENFTYGQNFLVNAENKNFTYADFEQIQIANGYSPDAPSESVPSSDLSIYYSGSNNIPDANGYPFAYSIKYLEPNGAIKYSPAGYGADFLLSGDHKNKHFFMKPTQEELDKVFGTNYVLDEMVMKSVSYDANNVGTVSYIDNEGKTIATALLQCDANPELERLSLRGTDEDGNEPNPTPVPEDYWVTVTPLSNQNLNTTTISLHAEESFLAPCESNLIKIDYSLSAGNFNYQGVPGDDPNNDYCEKCLYDVTLEIVNQETGLTIEIPVDEQSGTPPIDCSTGLEYSIIDADPIVTPGYSLTISQNNDIIQIDGLPGPAQYSVKRVIKPYEGSTGEQRWQEVISEVETQFSDNDDNLRDYYADQFGSYHTSFAIRQKLTSEFQVGLPLPNNECGNTQTLMGTDENCQVVDNIDNADFDYPVSVFGRMGTNEFYVLDRNAYTLRGVEFPPKEVLEEFESHVLYGSGSSSGSGQEQPNPLDDQAINEVTQNWGQWFYEAGYEIMSPAAIAGAYMAVVAGEGCVPGTNDAVGSLAHFADPLDMTSRLNHPFIYILDKQGTSYAIRRFEKNSKTVTTLASGGSTYFLPTSSQPVSIQLSPNGNIIYILYSDGVIYKLTSLTTPENITAELIDQNTLLTCNISPGANFKDLICLDNYVLLASAVSPNSAQIIRLSSLNGTQFTSTCEVPAISVSGIVDGGLNQPITSVSDIAQISIAPDGGIYFLDINSVRKIIKEDGDYTKIITLSGDGTPGFVDGNEAVAKQSDPTNIQTIPETNGVYVTNGNGSIRVVYEDVCAPETGLEITKDQLSYLDEMDIIENRDGSYSLKGLDGHIFKGLTPSNIPDNPRLTSNEEYNNLIANNNPSNPDYTLENFLSLYNQANGTDYEVSDINNYNIYTFNQASGIKHMLPLLNDNNTLENNITDPLYDYWVIDIYLPGLTCDQQCTPVPTYNVDCSDLEDAYLADVYFKQEDLKKSTLVYDFQGTNSLYQLAKKFYPFSDELLVELERDVDQNGDGVIDADLYADFEYAKNVYYLFDREVCENGGLVDNTCISCLYETNAEVYVALEELLNAYNVLAQEVEKGTSLSLSEFTSNQDEWESKLGARFYDYLTMQDGNRINRLPNNGTNPFSPSSPYYGIIDLIRKKIFFDFKIKNGAFSRTLPVFSTNLGNSDCEKIRLRALQNLGQLEKRIPVIFYDYLTDFRGPDLEAVYANCQSRATASTTDFASTLPDYEIKTLHDDCHDINGTTLNLLAHRKMMIADEMQHLLEGYTVPMFCNSTDNYYGLEYSCSALTISPFTSAQEGNCIDIAIARAYWEIIGEFYPSGNTAAIDFAENVSQSDFEKKYRTICDRIACQIKCEFDLEFEYQQWKTEVKTETIRNIREDYIEQCMGSLSENFTVQYIESMQHYTLYKYDRKGRLLSTTPPEGVRYMEQGNPTPPHHFMQTQYTYSEGQMVSTTTPDGGTTNFVYDEVGRLRFSQDADQAARSVTAGHQIFSYTKYDSKSRILETGEYEDFSNLLNGSDFSYPRPSSSNLYTLAKNIAFPNLAENKKDYVRTVYDVPTFSNNPSIPFQKNLDNRVSGIYTEYGSTHYSYDAHGRVNFVLQNLQPDELNFSEKNPPSGISPSPLAKTPLHIQKWVEYEYSPYTGKILQVAYMKGVLNEQFFHRYSYDENERIVKVENSLNGITWSESATYDYYKHGPLKIKTLGTELQQLDYVYTINGWLKAINNPQDIAPQGNFAPDVFAEAINYYNGDFNSTSFSKSDFFNASGKQIQNETKELFNGNIAGIAYYTEHAQTGNSKTKNLLIEAYSYDVLNRFKSSYVEAHENLDLKNATGDISTDFAMNLVYDANGNITSLNRNLQSCYYASLSILDGLTPWQILNLDQNCLIEDNRMDQLTYHFNLDADGNKINNQLLYVRDGYSLNNTYFNVDDIKDQSAAPLLGSNYEYDAKGRLIKDRAENIDNIAWTAFDKVEQINRQTNTQPSLQFTYNGTGNRTTKYVKTVGDNNHVITSYVYGADNNLMAVYSSEYNAADESWETYIEDRIIYGSQREGVYGQRQLANTKPVFEVNEINKLLNQITATTRTVLDQEVNVLTGFINTVSGQVVGIVESGLEKKIERTIQSVLKSTIDETALKLANNLSATPAEITTEINVLVSNIRQLNPETDLERVLSDFIINDIRLAEDDYYLKYLSSRLSASIVSQLVEANYFEALELQLSNDLLAYLDGQNYSTLASTDVAQILEVYQPTTGIIVSAYLRSAFNTAFVTELSKTIDQVVGIESYQELVNVSETVLRYELSRYLTTLAGVEISCTAYKDGYTLPVYNSELPGVDLLRLNPQTPGTVNGLGLNSIVSPLANWVSRYVPTSGNMPDIPLLNPENEAFAVVKVDEQCFAFDTSSVTRLVKSIKLMHDSGIVKPFEKPITEFLEKNGTTIESVGSILDNTLKEAGTIAIKEVTNVTAAIKNSLPALDGGTDGVLGNVIKGVTGLVGPILPIGGLDPDPDFYEDFYFELSDHLGNVRAVVKNEKQGSLATITSLTDYYPFGMIMPGRSYTSDNYRYGYNGMEKDDEISGVGNSYTAEFWQYDSRLGRRWNIDPVDQVSISNYAAFRNNPIFYIDPLGNKPGDFYDQKGDYLGTDGKSDKKVYVVTDRREAKDIKKTDKENGLTSLENVTSAIELPSKMIRQEMLKAVEMDKKEPYREHGGVFGDDANGDEKLVWSKPGDEADPSKVSYAEIDVFDAANPSEQNSLSKIKGTFHTHPSGTKSSKPLLDPFGGTTIGGETKTSAFLQNPSDKDIENSANREASGRVHGNSYVLGTRSGKVEIYNGNGEQASFPLSKWGAVGQ